MGTMTVGLVVAGIVVIAGIGLAVRWRSGSDEQHALRHYQNALDTLRTVSDRLESTRPSEVDPSQTVREAPGPQGRPAAAPRAAPAARSTHVTTSRITSSNFIRETDSAPDRRDHRAGEGRQGHPGIGSSGHEEPVFVFEDDAAASSQAGAASAATAPTRATRLALQRSSRPPSRIPAVMGLMLVAVLIVVGIVVVLEKNHHTAVPTAHTDTSTTTHHQKTTSPTTTPTTTPPTSTVPQAIQPQAASVTPQGATYAAPDVPYTVTLSSTGACWIYASLESTGAVVWTGVLNAGQTQNLSATGQLEVKFGHANSVTVALNGTPVDYPPQYQAVFAMQFIPQSA
jgi:hypothetical protein